MEKNEKANEGMGLNTWGGDGVECVVMDWCDTI